MDGHVSKVPGSAIQLVYRSGRQTPKSNRLTTIKRPARTLMAIELLVRDRSPRLDRQREDLEVLESGLRDA